ncbi:MAG: hypothetical protein H6577_01290 [Lewinellaceae bacterium]|nr:hypothetical protein [Saprospiraceae bacterium]MCB9336739.1 hypothetical protein [Lewinellaceae bacterium]
MRFNRLCLFFLLSILPSLKTLAQDTIYFENRNPYPVIIEEENEEEIIYRRADVRNSPRFKLRKRFVSQIKYEDPEAGKLKFKSKPIRTARQLDIWVTPFDSSDIVKGTLHRLNDTTLLLRKKPSLLEKGSQVNSDFLYNFPYQRIHTIHVRRRNTIQRNALWGAAGGFALGTLTGLIIFKNEPACETIGPEGPACDHSLSSPRTKWEKSLLLGSFTASGGFLAGGLTGAIRVKIPIAGRKDAFNAAIPILERMARVQQEVDDSPQMHKKKNKKKKNPPEKRKKEKKKKGKRKK